MRNYQNIQNGFNFIYVRKCRFLFRTHSRTSFC
jgi:hypothetical protein